jgi:hypothetical protein
MSALAADDGTHSFLAFLSAAQKEDGEKQAPEPAATKQLNAEANLLVYRLARGKYTSRLTIRLHSLYLLHQVYYHHHYLKCHH